MLNQFIEWFQFHFDFNVYKQQITRVFYHHETKVNWKQKRIETRKISCMAKPYVAHTALPRGQKKFLNGRKTGTCEVLRLLRRASN